MPGTLRMGCSTTDLGSSRPLHEAAAQLGSRSAGRPGTGLDAGRRSTSMHQRLGQAGAQHLHCSAGVTVTDGSTDRRERY